LNSNVQWDPRRLLFDRQVWLHGTGGDRVDPNMQTGEHHRPATAFPREIRPDTGAGQAEPRCSGGNAELGQLAAEEARASALQFEEQRKEMMKAQSAGDVWINRIILRTVRYRQSGCLHQRIDRTDTRQLEWTVVLVLSE
jgi:hypothetical protein